MRRCERNFCHELMCKASRSCSMCVAAFATWPAFLQSAEKGRMAAAVPNALKAHSENLGRPWELKWVRIKLIPFGRKAGILEDEPHGNNSTPVYSVTHGFSASAPSGSSSPMAAAAAPSTAVMAAASSAFLRSFSASSFAVSSAA